MKSMTLSKFSNYFIILCIPIGFRNSLDGKLNVKSNVKRNVNEILGENIDIPKILRGINTTKLERAKK